MGQGCLPEEKASKLSLKQVLGKWTVLHMVVTTCVKEWGRQEQDSFCELTQSDDKLQGVEVGIVKQGELV